MTGPTISDAVGLAERCEQATGPDDATDWAIAEAIGCAPGLPYTASIDAAMTLVPEGCVFNVMTDFDLPGRARIWGSVSPAQSQDRGWQADAATPALALCAASLRARAATGEAE